MKLHRKLIIKGTMELLSGIHIGASKESVDIGGVDSPVVRRKDNNQPYIPGSSLKGKIRSLLEIATGSNANSDFKVKSYQEENSKSIPLLFGSAGDGKNDDGSASRLLVRDSYLTEGSESKLKESEFVDMPYTEVKFENVINRLKGTAEHPRQIERIPAGAIFEVEFVINIITEKGDEQEAKQLEESFVKMINSGIGLLEDDYLGGNGSRGYGQVEFNLNTPVVKDVNTYFEAAK